MTGEDDIARFDSRRYRKFYMLLSKRFNFFELPHTNIHSMIKKLLRIFSLHVNRLERSPFLWSITVINHYCELLWLIITTDTEITLYCTYIVSVSTLWMSARMPIYRICYDLYRILKIVQTLPNVSLYNTDESSSPPSCIFGMSASCQSINQIRVKSEAVAGGLACVSWDTPG